MRKKANITKKRKGANKNISNATTPTTPCAPESKRVKSSVPLDFTHDRIYKDYQNEQNKRIAIVSKYQSIGSPHQSLWNGGVLKQLSDLLKPIYGYIRLDTILNDTPQLKVYSNRPVGNSPEMMPWDCSLNKDVLDGLNRHVLLTKDLPNDNPKKFSLSTPKNIDHAIKRLVFRSTLNDTGGIPSKERIEQDILKCAGANILSIIEAKGAAIQGLGDRQGVRFIRKGGHGGVRPAKAIRKETRWLHDDALATLFHDLNQTRQRDF